MAGNTTNTAQARQSRSVVRQIQLSFWMMQTPSGIAWAPRWLVVDALREGRLAPLLSDWAGEETTMSIERRVQDHRPERIDQVISFSKRTRHRLARCVTLQYYASRFR
jgi:DNA-binding transcriptional LysR family regulator